MTVVRGVVLSLLVVGTSWTVRAQAPATVKVGNATKIAVGTVTSLDNGDIACYVHLRDDAGKSFTEKADFDICFQKPSLVGKRVTLTYKLEKVMAASCQGDPDCKKTDTVPLIVAVKITPAAPAPVTKSGPTTASGSLCASGEDVVFSCAIGKKVVSVCASKNLSSTTGWAQYRFGVPGSAPEITLPVGQVHPTKVSYGATESFSGGGGAWLRFKNGPTSYVVFTGIGKWGPKGQTLSKAGVVVEQNQKQTAFLSCSTKETSELGPDWFSKAGIVPNSKEFFDFPEGATTRQARALRPVR